MTGEELRNKIKGKGISMRQVAEEMGITSQNLNSKLNAQNVKSDFLSKVEAIIDRCCPPLPAEMQTAVIGSNINGSHSPNVQQTAGPSTALSRENELLRQQIALLQSQLADKEKIISLLEGRK